MHSPHFIDPINRSELYKFQLHFLDKLFVLMLQFMFSTGLTSTHDVNFLAWLVPVLPFAWKSDSLISIFIPLHFVDNALTHWAYYLWLEARKLTNQCYRYFPDNLFDLTVQDCGSIIALYWRKYLFVLWVSLCIVFVAIFRWVGSSVRWWLILYCLVLFGNNLFLSVILFSINLWQFTDCEVHFDSEVLPLPLYFFTLQSFVACY